ncbi:MAG: kinase inhibitor [Candidatus Magasanikbacteria bacterium RIFCSPHIGHO2_01_FULL_47_8]|uniref:Kinase inhibitor n=1 Tax=Candidatus Magasanikbacteria bacterium RIFCSPHIGHO2_01_FULL_47_8 TaxID=1798673 RepID=A0A1F6MCQ3_9BACT|nr:MAG: kinase inhibitor [Candidatus Magasanikbacteria bacterium RIFCSPHIGHO2_01_FULL_47_8]
MRISSPAFTDHGNVPGKYTCDGQNVNPPLLFEEVPANAKILALVVDDPDSPSGTWTHWTVWNIDPNVTEIPENSVPPGAVEGITSFKRSGWGGPCPASGIHRYFFKLYALDGELVGLTPQSSEEEVKTAMNGHLVATAELVGLYSRSR